MKNNTLFVFNAEANKNKKRVNNNTLFVFDAEANKKRVNNNTLFVFDAEANNNKKVVYMGRSEVGGGETCFCEKHWPLRLLRTVLLPSKLLIKQWN